MRNIGKFPNLNHRIGDDFGNRRLVIGQPVDEGGICAILEQAADQIGQQVLMAPHRRIDAARLVHPGGAHHLFIERLPHAMQPLELEAPVIARHHRDRSQRMRVMRCKLRIEHIAPLKQELRAGKIAHIRRNLARE